MTAKISDLITRLEELKKACGDLDVLICVWDGECEQNAEMTVGVETVYGFGVDPKKAIVITEAVRDGH